MVAIDPDVYYSCGACGYPLHLSSSQRSGGSNSSSNISSTTTVSFVSIEGTRIRQLHEFKCAPYIHADGSMGLHQSKTKLLCGKCGNVIGHCHSSHAHHASSNHHKRYCLKLKALDLQPCI